MQAFNEFLGWLIIIPSVVIVAIVYLGKMLAAANPEMAGKVKDRAKQRAVDYAKQRWG